MTIRNNFLFSFIFILISFISLYLPDIDQSILSFLGHRSLITHSFLIPFLFNYYFLDKKDKPNIFFQIIAINLFFGFSVNFCADLISKGWRGTALITVLGMRFPAVISIMWIFINAIICMVFANKILGKFFNTKSTSYIFYFLGTVIAFIYFNNDYVAEPLPQFIIFILIHSVIFFYFLKKNNKKIIKNEVKVEQKIKDFRDGKKIKLIKKSNINNYTGLIIFFAVAIFLLLILIFFFQGKDNKNSKKSIQESYRSKGVYQDELDLCKLQIINTYPKVSFTRIEFSGFTAPQNKLSYNKVIHMWMNHKQLFLDFSFGKIDCNIRVNDDQSISFTSLSAKYDN